jgi:hypothetical protein
MRRVGDLDLLIPPRDVRLARVLLATRGYRPEPPLTVVQEAVLAGSRAARMLLRAEGRVFLDVHWALLRKPLLHRVKPAALWSRRACVQLGDRLVPCLSREDMLLAACAHGAKHSWSRLDWVCDVARLAGGTSEVRWARTVARARTYGCRRMLFLGLRLAGELLGASFPPAVQAELEADPAVASLAAAVRGRLAAGAAGDEDSLENHLFLLRTMDRSGDRLRYCLHMAANPTELEAGALPLPPPLSPVYRVVRPLRVVWRHGGRAYRLARRVLAAAPAARDA